MELEYWMGTFRTMTTESALLTGFCFGGMRAAQGSTLWVLNMFYLSMTACSMGFGLLCISTATFVSTSFLSILTVSLIYSLLSLERKELWWANKLTNLWISQSILWNANRITASTSSSLRYVSSLSRLSCWCGSCITLSLPWQQMASLPSVFSSLCRTAPSWSICFISPTTRPSTISSVTRTVLMILRHVKDDLHKMEEEVIKNQEATIVR